MQKESCRNHYFEFCYCYDYVCKVCGWPYKYDEYSAHWTPDMNCINCDEPIPDIGCVPKIFQDPKQNQTKPEQQRIFKEL